MLSLPIHPPPPPTNTELILGGRAKFLKTSKVKPEGPMLKYESIKFNFHSFKRKAEGFYWGHYWFNMYHVGFVGCWLFEKKHNM